MADSTVYKTYARQGRVIEKDSTYNGGMYFTNRALGSGYNRNMVNLVSIDSGETLSTRAGLKIETDFTDEYPGDEDLLVPVTFFNQTQFLESIRMRVAGQYSSWCGHRQQEPSYADGIVSMMPPRVSPPFANGGNGTPPPASVTQIIMAVPQGSTMPGSNPNYYYDFDKTCALAINGIYKYAPTFDAQLGFSYFQRTPYFVGGDNFRVNVFTPELKAFNNIPFSTLAYMGKPVSTACFDGQFVAFGYDLDQSMPITWTAPTTTIGNVKRGIAQIKQLVSGDYYDLLGKNQAAGSHGGHLSTFDLVTPKTLFPSEAAAWGYNMAADNPYIFENGTTGTTLVLVGVLPYNTTNQLNLNPRLNETMYLRAFFNVADQTGWTLKFEWKGLTESTWNNIGSVAASTGRIRFTNPGKEIQVKVSATKSGVTSEETIYAGFDFTPSAERTEFQYYDLLGAEHLTYWKHGRRLVAYGVSDARNAIFLSDMNDPTYFPYPNNFEQFDEPVVKVVEYLNGMLVFTEKNLWLIELNTDGLTWTRTLIQGGLTIDVGDSEYTQIIKTFVFFKQGNYFYMVVPYNSTAGALAISPISNNIKELLDDFDGYVRETMLTTYGAVDGFELHKVQTYATLNDIHVACSFWIPNKNTYFNLVLIYSTLYRTWHTWTFESPYLFIPHHEKSYTYPRLITNSYKIALPVDQPGKTLMIADYLHFDDDNNDITDQFGTNYQNWHVLDTGYRDIASQVKKTFREAQFMLYVPENTILKFSTEFLIDQRSGREYPGKFIVGHQTDPSNPNYGYIDVMFDPMYDDLRTAFLNPQEDGTIVSDTTLSPVSPMEPSEYWHLDISAFRQIRHWRVRYYVKGKGEAGRLIVRSQNEKRFDITENMWVFRYMYGR